MKVDITSTTLEKGFDLAKSFLDKLVGPPLEEIGLLLKETVTLWRFKNQINVVNKAREYCLKHNIAPRKISLKILAPLMENASLEEDEMLQDKWAMLLSNMADSEQNIQNHVFPYLLSQISKNEFEVIEKAVVSKNIRISQLKEELTKSFTDEDLQKEQDLLKEIEELPDNERRKYGLKYQVKELTKERTRLNNLIKIPESLPSGLLQEFELSNLIRLGIIKSVAEHYVYAEPLTIPAIYEYQRETTFDIEIGIEPDGDYQVLTELGELFLLACSEKK